MNIHVVIFAHERTKSSANSIAQDVLVLAFSAKTSMLIMKRSELSTYPWCIPDMPQFRGGNPYFLSENLYQSVSVTNASMYPRHFARDSHRDAVCTKIPIPHNKIKITILLLS